MSSVQKAKSLLGQIKAMAKAQGKATGFCIGNTAKVDVQGLYFTPIRNTALMVAAGVIVYSEKQAIEIAKAVDGRCDYVLVDAEKKVPDDMSLSGEPANVERAVREVIKKSTLWIYKGNDLSVQALDGLIMRLTKDDLRGVGGKKIVILGAGNLGFKLALKLVERGAKVVITRRNKKKLNLIVEALNTIKPSYTRARVTGMTDNHKAAQNADILIGLTQGKEVITEAMIDQLKSGGFIIDGGKGTVSAKALKRATQRGVTAYRLDITAAFEGLVSELFAVENLVGQSLGRRQVGKHVLVSGGLLAGHKEIVVDNVYNPRVVYGMANGQGDFIRALTTEDQKVMSSLEVAIKKGRLIMARV